MDEIEYLLSRRRLSGGVETTVYAVRHPRSSTRVRVVHFPETERLDVWCVANGVDEAIIGGFFLRDPYRPLGELVIDGRGVQHEPVTEPFGPRRACVSVVDDEVRLGPLDEVAGDSARHVVQAGPLLVRDGAVIFDRERDVEGLSFGCGQFDSDITDGRHPRAALGVSDDFLVAVACDGRRSRVDGGLEMSELGRLMVELGAESAINLDGGGSTTLVHRRHLLNRPYSTQDQPDPESRPIVSALVFERHD